VSRQCEIPFLLVLERTLQGQLLQIAGWQEQRRANRLFRAPAPLVLLLALEESCYALSAGRMDGERVANVKSTSLSL